MAYVKDQMGDSVPSDEVLEAVWKFLCDGKSVLTRASLDKAIAKVEELQKQGRIPRMDDGK